MKKAQQMLGFLNSPCRTRTYNLSVNRECVAVVWAGILGAWRGLKRG